jgi:hypothetical protein
MTLVELIDGKRDCDCEGCQQRKAELAVFCRRFPKASVDELCARFEMAQAAGCAAMKHFKMLNRKTDGRSSREMTFEDWCELKRDIRSSVMKKGNDNGKRQAARRNKRLETRP